jgi:hypothetical protein
MTASFSPTWTVGRRLLRHPAVVAQPIDVRLLAGLLIDLLEGGAGGGQAGKVELTELDLAAHALELELGLLESGRELGIDELQHAPIIRILVRESK